MRIGAAELVIVLIVALVVLGPDKLPEYAARLGAALREFRKASSDITKEIKESVVDPLDDIQKPLKEAAEPLEKMNQEIRGDIREVEKEFRNIGHNDSKEKSVSDGESSAEQKGSQKDTEKPEEKPEQTEGQES